jgi:hypothetical protein
MAELVEEFDVTKHSAQTADDRQYVLDRIRVNEAGCWEWQMALTPAGYGMVRFSSRGISTGAHRFAYAAFVGPIPEGLVLDHLCRYPACVNPAHLEPVTQEDNLKRGNSVAAIVTRTKVCIHGHDLTGDNLYVSPGGFRKCRTCLRNRRAERYQRDKERLGIPDFKPQGVCNVPDCGKPHNSFGMCRTHYMQQKRARDRAARAATSG